MAIIFGITAFLFFAVLPVLTTVLLIKPRLLKRYLKIKKPHRGKIFGSTSAIALLLFIFMGITVPPVGNQQTQTVANTNNAKEQQKLSVNQTKLADQQSKTIAKNSAKIDKENAKTASKIDIHNSTIEVMNDGRYKYNIVTNSNTYDMKVVLSDKNKKNLESTDINHTSNNWFIISKYSPSEVKYITYSISLGSKYYDSKKQVRLSKDIQDYPAIASSVKVINTQIIKDNNRYTYLFSFSSRSYDSKIELFNDKNQIIYSKDFNHTNSSTSIDSIDLKPISMGGTIAYALVKVSIKNKLYSTSPKIAFSKSIDDKDQARIIDKQKAEASAEATRQKAASEETARQAAAAASAAKASPQPAPTSTYYKNCSAARAAGVTPIYRGQPGYGSHLDRDGDGIACE